MSTYLLAFGDDPQVRKVSCNPWHQEISHEIVVVVEDLFARADRGGDRGRPRGDQEHDYNHSQPQRSAVTKGWAESEIVFQGHRLLRQYVQGFQVPGL